jgi:AraC family transcriptional regulator
MDSFPQPVAAAPVDPADLCGVDWGLLGHVASERGVLLMATHGMPNGKPVNRITPAKMALSYSLRTPRDTAIGRRGKFASVGHLNLYSPGTSFLLRGSGPMTMSLCLLSPRFLAHLSEAESGFQLGELDILSDIQSERLLYLGRAMFREATQPGFASSLFAEAMGIAIALEIARYENALRSDEGYRGGLAPWQIRRLETYVQDHLSDQLNLAGLARLLDISVRHLSRTVRQAKGMSVHRWIAECRFSEARRLLAEKDLPIQDIAPRCAFQSVGAFSTAFLAASGCPPGEFRRLISGSSRLPRLNSLGVRGSGDDIA